MGTLMPLITSHMSEKRFSRVILINRFVLLKVYRLSIFIICFIYKKIINPYFNRISDDIFSLSLWCPKNVNSIFQLFVTKPP